MIRYIGRPQSQRVDLGLILLSMVQKPGEALTAADIAAWCDCTRENILRIERRALKKLRAKIRCGERTVSEELNDAAPKKMRADRFTGLVAAGVSAAPREISLKQWVMEQATREGVTPGAIYMRMYRHPEKAPPMRWKNGRVVLVKLAP